MKIVKIGIAGLGTVGRGVFEILRDNQELLSFRTNCKFEVVAVASRTKKDFIPDHIRYYDNILHLAQDSHVDIIVELLGGYDLPLDLIHHALKNNKKIVTANKALLAEHGRQILSWVDKYQGVIGFEACVAGANPVIKSYKESFVANDIHEIYAILNGTCNFILTKMKNDRQDYKIALKQAQENGFAEADPSFDVKGIDSGHKIVLLAALAAGSLPNFSDTYIEGIDKIALEDIDLANELGYKIKLLGVFKNIQGKIFQANYPALISNNEKISQIDGSYNAVLTRGSNFEYNFMVGRGAGGKPTGSAVVADIVDIACERHYQRNHNFLFAGDSVNLTEVKISNIKNRLGKYFIIFNFNKNSVAKNKIIDEVFGARIAIDKVVYKVAKDDENIIFCGALTHDYCEQEIDEAIGLIDKTLVNNIKYIRVEQTNF